MDLLRPNRNSPLVYTCANFRFYSSIYYDLTVTAPNYQSTTYLNQSVPFNSERSIGFWLARSNQTTGRLTGTVRDLFTSAPIPNAVVSGHTQVRTNDQGRYTLANQPVGTFDVSVSATNYNSQQVTVRLASGDNPLDFFLVPAEYPTGGVWGGLYDNTTGFGVINGTVTAVAPNGLTLADYTGPYDNLYFLGGLPHDTPFTLTASAPGYQSASVTNFYPRRGANVGIDFTLRPDWGFWSSSPPLRGQVTLSDFEGDPSRVWLTVEVYQYGALIWREDVRLKSDGSFRVRCPLEETADLRLKADRWLSVWLHNVDLSVRELPTVTFTRNADPNNDDRVDDRDISILMTRFGKAEKNAPDLNGDGLVNYRDLRLVLLRFGERGEEGGI